MIEEAPGHRELAHPRGDWRPSLSQELVLGELVSDRDEIPVGATGDDREAPISVRADQFMIADAPPRERPGVDQELAGMATPTERAPRVAPRVPGQRVAVPRYWPPEGPTLPGYLLGTPLEHVARGPPEVNRPILGPPVVQTVLVALNPAEQEDPAVDAVRPLLIVAAPAPLQRGQRSGS